MFVKRHPHKHTQSDLGAAAPSRARRHTPVSLHLRSPVTGFHKDDPGVTSESQQEH